MEKKTKPALEKGHGPRHQRIGRQAFSLAWQTVRWTQQFPEHMRDELLMIEECGAHMRTAAMAASSCLMARNFAEAHRG